MTATIKEVARLAGVSTASVSRVFNDSAAVEEATRQRVREAARQLHYTPHPIGRSLSTRRTDAIGLLLPDLYGEFFSEVIRGCDQTAQKNHFHLLVSSSHSNREEIESALKMMRGRVDGLIIMSPDIDAQSLRANLPASLPIVLLDSHVGDETYDAITIDNYAGAYKMVEHLVGHHYTRIAIVKGTRYNLDAQRRLEGYRAAVAEFGCDRSEALEQTGDFSDSSGYDAARKLLALSQRPRAIFASNDTMAIGVLSALHEAGVRVPEEIAVVGFDDIPVASYLMPALTSVHVDIVSLGNLAVDHLLSAIRKNGRITSRRTILSTSLAIRNSCGCTSTISAAQGRG